MPEMTGGQAIVQTLIREGVDVIFGLPGVQMYGIIDALRDEPGIRMITARHEGTTGHLGIAVLKEKADRRSIAREVEEEIAEIDRQAAVDEASDIVSGEDDGNESKES